MTCGLTACIQSIERPVKDGSPTGRAAVPSSWLQEQAHLEHTTATAAGDGHTPARNDGRHNSARWFRFWETRHPASRMAAGRPISEDLRFGSDAVHDGARPVRSDTAEVAAVEPASDLAARNRQLRETWRLPRAFTPDNRGMLIGDGSGFGQWLLHCRIRARQLLRPLSGARYMPPLIPLAAGFQALRIGYRT